MDKKLINLIVQRGLAATVKSGLRKGNLVGNEHQIKAAKELIKIDPSKMIAAVSMIAVLDDSEPNSFKVFGVIAGSEIQIQALDILAHHAVEDAINRRQDTTSDEVQGEFDAEVPDDCMCTNCVARRQIIDNFTPEEREEISKH